ncbi:MAG: hypothetical protein ACPLXC_00015 [Candidatus Pacearchaeota archaeon]
MLRIEEGIVMSYFCFDVGNEIRLEEIEKVLGKKAEQILLTYERLTPEYVQYKTPPLFIRVGVEKVNGKEWGIDAKIYDFGVVTVRLWTGIEGTTVEITKSLNKAEQEIKKKAFTILNKILGEIKAYIEKPLIDVEKTFSNYNIFFVQRFERAWKPQDIVKRFGDEIAHFLRYESKKLSEPEIRDIIKNPLSYYSDDLTIIDFNAALIYDPRKSYDVPDVLEYAIIELTELRVYDNFLDSVLETTYEELGKKKFFARGKIIDKLSQIKLEVSEVKEKVENFIKLIDDSYLGKIYVAASNKFYLEKWKSSVKEKLELLESLYSKSWDRLQTSRNIWLEAAIVALFILDIILILWELFGKKIGL